jgi:hypothetical protein
LKDEHFEIPSRAEIIVQEKLSVGNEKRTLNSLETASFFGFICDHAKDSMNFQNRAIKIVSLPII